MSLAFLDIETTGFNPGLGAEVLEIAVLKCNESNCHPFSRLQAMVRPKKPVPKEATDINGITNGMVKYAEDISYTLNDIFSYIRPSDTIVGHNIIKFDIPFLEFFLERKIDNKTIDTLSLAKQLGFKRGSSSLESLADYFGIKYNGNAHRALADVEVNRRVYIELMKMKQNKLF